MARTAEDLINELEEVASTAEKAGLVVGFERTTTYVWNDDVNRLPHLTEAMQFGGEPVGYLIHHSVAGSEQSMNITAVPLQEYRGEEWVNKYLTQLVENTAKQIIAFENKNRGEADGGT